MSDSKKPNRHFLDERRVKQGKRNEKDMNRAKKFDWRDNMEEEIEENYAFIDETNNKTV